jgi:hypothetical protein
MMDDEQAAEESKSKTNWENDPVQCPMQVQDGLLVLMGLADEVNIVSEIVISEDLIADFRLIYSGEINNRYAAILST